MSEPPSSRITCEARSIGAGQNKEQDVNALMKIWKGRGCRVNRSSTKTQHHDIASDAHAHFHSFNDCVCYIELILSGSKNGKKSDARAHDPML